MHVAYINPRLVHLYSHWPVLEDCMAIGERISEAMLLVKVRDVMSVKNIQSMEQYTDENTERYTDFCSSPRNHQLPTSIPRSIPEF